jgi:hypothetical protein
MSIARRTALPAGALDPIPRGGADMEYTMQLELVQRSLIPGVHVFGVDVSVEPRGWQRKRRDVVALDVFPTDNGTGVSAGGCRT